MECCKNCPFKDRKPLTGDEIADAVERGIRNAMMGKADNKKFIEGIERGVYKAATAAVQAIHDTDAKQQGNSLEQSGK